MTAPGSLPITIYAGKDFLLPLTWQQTTSGVTTVLNPTGRTLRIKSRKSAQSSQVVATFTSVAETLDGVANGTITLGGATADNIVLRMTDTESAKLQDYAGVYVYDCDWIAADGTVSPFLSGSLTVVAEITR